MNTSFRSVWNPALSAWVAVSEIARARGKSTASAVGIASVILCLGAAPALAGEGGAGGNPATATELYAGDGGADNAGGAGAFNDSVYNGFGGAGGAASTIGAAAGGAGDPGGFPPGLGSGASGGAAGTAVARDGQAGGGFDANDPSSNGYGGGGGAGYFGGTGASGTNSAPAVGGNGGAGGVGVWAAGGGGAGGYGFVLTPAATSFSNTSTLTGGNGGAGGAAFAQAGGGGGGGSALYQGSGDVINTGTLQGGNGGVGGAGGAWMNGPSGGGGGGGGNGVVMAGGTLRNEAGASIVGGNGGNGGDAGPTTNLVGVAGGAGGGGDGVRVLASGRNIFNAGSIAGGTGGTGGAANAGLIGAAGAGGAGVRLTGDNNTLVNAGAIAGGLSGDNVRADAVTVTGAANTVELRDGYSFTGNVVANGAGNVLALGGDTSPAAPFDVAAIGTTIQGFTAYDKTGLSTWTLTGTTPALTPWTVRGGVLQISNDANLGAAAGSVTFDGGTIRLFGAPADWTTSRAVSVLAGGGTLDLDQHSATFNGALSGAGALTVTSNTVTSANLGGVLNLNVAGTRTGTTTLSNGVNVNVNVSNALGSGDVSLVNGWNRLNFNGTASAGVSQVYTVGGLGATETNNGITFNDASSAGTAVFNLSGTDALTSRNTIDFKDTSSAEGSQIHSRGGVVTFADSSTAGASTLVNDGAGHLVFTDASNGGTASIANQGASQLQVLGDAQLATARVANLDSSKVDISGANAGVAIGSLRGAGSVSLGANALTLGGLNLDDAISGAIDGTGALNKTGTGTLTLSGPNSYTGTTTVASGTLQAGAVNTLSAASAHSVAAGATLDLAGASQTVASLANSGTVSLVGSTPGTRLTVTGAYVGNNGTLRLGTALGDSSSATDRLVLDGVGASASGRTTVQVTNLGGLGAQTTGSGIEVVSALNGATTTAQTTKSAFTLAGGHVDAGAFEYTLHAADASGAGDNWYLRSENTVPAPLQAGNPSAAVTAGISVPTYRAEVPLFAALPQQLRQADLAMLGNLHQRIGDEPVAGAASTGTRNAWGRVISTGIEVKQQGDAAPDSKGRLDGFQVGTDLWADGNWHAGIYVGQLDGDVSVNGFARGVQGSVGRNDLRSRYLGAYATWYGTNGFYADAVLQAGDHRYTVQPRGNAFASGKGDSQTASIEVGQSLALGQGWTIEPQLQLIYQRVDLDDVSISGARVQQDSDNGWVARAGVRVKGAMSTSLGALQPYGRLNLYRASSGTDIARFVGPAATTDIATRTGGTWGDVAGGLTLALNPTWSVYGEVGQMFAVGGSARIKSGVQGSIGVKARW